MEISRRKPASSATTAMCCSSHTQGLLTICPNWNEMMKTHRVPPSAAMLIESMRDIGYSLETALADLIDNSITSGASKIDIFVDPCENTAKIGILDNGGGMTKDELMTAMRPGSRSPLDERAATDLGRFGL